MDCPFLLLEWQSWGGGWGRRGCFRWRNTEKGPDREGSDWWPDPGIFQRAQRSVSGWRVQPPEEEEGEKRRGVLVCTPSALYSLWLCCMQGCGQLFENIASHLRRLSLITETMGSDSTRGRWSYEVTLLLAVRPCHAMFTCFCSLFLKILFRTSERLKLGWMNLENNYTDNFCLLHQYNASIRCRWWKDKSGDRVFTVDELYFWKVFRWGNTGV